MEMWIFLKAPMGLRRLDHFPNSPKRPLASKWLVFSKAIGENGGVIRSERGLYMHWYCTLFPIFFLVLFSFPPLARCFLLTKINPIKHFPVQTPTWNLFLHHPINPKAWAQTSEDCTNVWIFPRRRDLSHFDWPSAHFRSLCSKEG